jgi:hypothetical protein
MKFIYFFLLIPSLAFSQIDSTIVEFPTKDGKVVYESIVENPTLNKTKLYGASKKWIADTFKSAKNIIQSEDASSGQIIGKFYNELSNFKNDKSLVGKKFDTQCSIQIDVKDGKCRIRFYDISWVWPSKDMVTFTKPLDDFLNEADVKKYSKWLNKQKVNALYYGFIDSYKKAITSGVNDDF